MQHLRSAFAMCAMLALPLSAVSAPYFEDAALNGVQFVDRDEGWAVGDEGVVWHSIDGGRHWDRQPTGVRASLRSLHFLNPYTGWVVGREELTQGTGSVGVLLFTQDGGLHWRQMAPNALPGLNTVRFLNATDGFVAGDATEAFPSGAFATGDGGRSWKPVSGQRTIGWLAAAFKDGRTGLLSGVWDHLATVRDGQAAPADAELTGGRSLGGICLQGNRAVAAGEGGLVLVSDTAGLRWSPADLRLPTDVRASWDLHAVCASGDQVWAVGRPGSAVLHSGDCGQSWETLPTRQPLPLHAVFFLDERHGWAAGELGSVLATEDGGKTWSVCRLGSQRAAVLFVHARATAVPLDAVASLGGQEGYVAVALRVTGPDPASAAPGRAAEGQRLAAAMRQAGGAAGEMLWAFPVPQHLARSDGTALVKHWNPMHNDRAAEELTRQMVLAVRMWRPDVMITDLPDEKTAGCPADALVARAVREAFVKAADPTAFSGHIEVLGLEPWKVAKLYAETPERKGAQVVLDSTDVVPLLGASSQDCASAASALLGEASMGPSQRFFRLLEGRVAEASRQRELMDGTALAPGGTARRRYPDAAPAPEVLHAARTRRNLEAIALVPVGRVGDPQRLLAQVGPSLASMPDGQAAATALAIAQQYARRGQWALAQEAYLLVADRYATHPLAADAYRWLIRHNASSEAQRREQVGEVFVATGVIGLDTHPDAERKIPGQGEKAAATIRGEILPVGGQVVEGVCDPRELRKWFRASLELGKRLEALGPVYATDPTVQFPIQAARRQLGRFDAALDWFTRFKSQAVEGPWRDAAAAEIWLANRSGPPPKPVVWCRQLASRPYLDGKLDDPCWEGIRPVTLKDAVGETAKEYGTQVWLAHDQDYLYLAVRCRHPEGRQVPTVKVRPRDADLRPFDHVGLLLDLDRDYATYFHFQIDQRGCVCEDCWGDRSWDPNWFVAIQSEPTCWQVEAAIPLLELTGDRLTEGKAWACNVVRVLPGRGVQAWSTPADVQPRPEGMGLLMFTKDPPPPRGK